MKLVKALLLATLLLLSPTLVLADMDLSDDIAGDDFAPAVPEPTSALLMVTGLVTFGLARRNRR